MEKKNCPRVPFGPASLPSAYASSSPGKGRDGVFTMGLPARRAEAAKGKPGGVTGPGTTGCLLSAESARGDRPSDGASLDIAAPSRRRGCTGSGWGRAPRGGAGGDAHPLLPKLRLHLRVPLG